MTTLPSAGAMMNELSFKAFSGIFLGGSRKNQNVKAANKIPMPANGYDTQLFETKKDEIIKIALMASMTIILSVPYFVNIL
jgi:hypothetical protein